MSDPSAGSMVSAREPQPPTGLPPERALDSKYRGLGGWLILVGIGIVLSPLIFLWQGVMLLSVVFGDGLWDQFMMAGSPYHNPAGAYVLLFEIVIQFAMAAFSLWLAMLFFTRRRRFPSTFILFQLTLLALILIDAVLVSIAFPEVPVFDEETVGLLLRVIVPSCIWIPYMLVSKRVKQTFVEG